MIIASKLWPKHASAKQEPDSPAAGRQLVPEIRAGRRMWKAKQLDLFWGEKDLECKLGPDPSGMCVLFSVFETTKGVTQTQTRLAVLLKAGAQLSPEWWFWRWDRS